MFVTPLVLPVGLACDAGGKGPQRKREPNSPLQRGLRVPVSRYSVEETPFTDHFLSLVLTSLHFRSRWTKLNKFSLIRIYSFS